MDEYARGEARQRNWPEGMIADDAQNNITVWIKDWSEVINDARARLNFLNSQLLYEADKDSSTGYLETTHKKFIPDLSEQVLEEGSEDLEADLSAS